MRTRGGATRARIDWQDLRARLGRAQAGLAAAEQLSAEQAKAVMDERARALAQVPERAPDTKEILEVLTARLANERIAIETRFVREVYRPGEITPVPGSPPFLAGVTNLRGEVLAVMDLREFFGLPAAETAERPQTVVVGLDRPEFGLIVDEIYEVAKLRIAEVLEPPGSIAGLSRDCLRGVTADALLVLDGHMLLTDRRLYVDEGGGP
jgi:purine-binding chemotaxis protein CheW